MEFGITPSYRDIFKEETPDLSTLISDIPSKAIIKFLSAVNADLFFSEDTNGRETQSKIFRFWTQNFTDAQRNLVFTGIQPFLKRSAIFFTLWYSTEFIQRELMNFRDFQFNDTTPEQEYRLFQAYFIIVEQCNDSHLKLFKSEAGEEAIPNELRFQKVTWPMLAGQFAFNYKVDPIYQIAKTFVLLKYLEKEPGTTKYIHNFLREVKRETILHYLFDLLSFVNYSFTHDEKQPFKRFTFTASPEFQVLFDGWCIDVSDLKNHPEKQTDYVGLREKPLFKTTEGKYVALNWSFLYNQLNLGLLFAFHKISGISEKYRTFPDFRSHIAKTVSEQIIFSGIIKKALEKKHAVLVCSEKSELPDCYFREQKYIYLFEFKDVLMPAKMIGSCNFHAIKDDIDIKFIESKDGKKGIRQILQQIITLNQKDFEEDNFTAKGFKRRNIILYPVIIYTHFMYTMPGINNYLNNIFRKELEEADKQTKIHFREVKDLVMIDLEFLYKNFLYLKNGDYKLRNLLDQYINIQSKARDKAERESSTANIIKANSSFDEVLNFPRSPNKKDFVKELFEALGIVD